MDERDQALALMANVQGVAGWLNKLDKLFSVVRDCAVSVASEHNSDSVDDLLAACEAFRMEFYGTNQGEDHPDAAAVSEASDDLPEDHIAAMVGGRAVALPRHDVAALVIENAKKDFSSEEMDTVIDFLMRVYPNPPPVIVLAAMRISALSEKDMEEHGWVRKNSQNTGK